MIFAVGRGTELQPTSSRVHFPMVSLELFNNIIIPCDRGVDSASNRNEYQIYCLWSKEGWCVELTTIPHYCVDCLEIWEPQPPRTLTNCPRMYMDNFTFTFSLHILVLPSKETDGLQLKIRILNGVRRHMLFNPYPTNVENRVSS